MPKYTKTELAELKGEIENLKQQIREREGESLRKLLVHSLNIFATNWFFYSNYHHYQQSQ